jgi:hypothetical protein
VEKGWDDAKRVAEVGEGRESRLAQIGQPQGRSGLVRGWKMTALEVIKCVE